MREIDFRPFIRDVPDFPTRGVIFKDITPLLGDADMFVAAVEAMADPFDGDDVTKVVGIEARGFIFAGPIARRLGTGFVPIRKAGKLPHHVTHQDYELEYGSDRIEIHSDSIQPEDRVLIVDDVLATGGTGAASVHLINTLGAEVVGISVFIELNFLQGRDRLGGTNVHSVLQYGTD